MGIDSRVIVGVCLNVLGIYPAYISFDVPIFNQELADEIGLQRLTTKFISVYEKYLIQLKCSFGGIFLTIVVRLPETLSTSLRGEVS